MGCLHRNTNTEPTKATVTKTVEQTFDITYDPTKFTPEFLEHFRQHFYDFETVDDHLNHIADCIARGIAYGPECFLEGYGKLSTFGITWRRA